SVDSNVSDTKEVTISYADSQSELVIASTFNGSNSSAIVKVNDVLYTPTTKLNNNDVLTIEVSDTVGSETVNKTYTRTIKVTPASTNTNINVTTNKNTLVTKNLYDGNQTYNIEVPFSVTEINALITASDTKATLSAAVSGTTTLSFTSLQVGVAQTKTVTITAESGATKTYNITITRLDGDSNTNATIKVNNAATSYDASLDAYTYTIPQATTNYTVVATPEKTTTKVYYSEDGISYSPTTLAGILQKGGTQTVFVKVESENGTEEIYTV